MTHDILAILAILLWCLTGTVLLNRLPMLSDPRLHGKLRRGFRGNSPLVTLALVTLWPARTLICAWLTKRLQR